MLRTSQSWLVCTLLLSSPAFAAPNLLNVNPDFESGDGGVYNGTGKVAGWNFQNLGYQFFGVGNGGNASPKAFSLTNGGWLETAPEARPTATPGLVYRLSFDCRKTRDQYPDKFIGVRAEIRFYDATGKLLHFYRPPEFLNGPPTDWQNVTLQCVAPPDAERVGAFVENWQGQFMDTQHNYTNARDVKVDNFKLETIPETVETVRFRRAPRLIEPGQTAHLSLITQINEARKISVQLRRGKTVYPAMMQSVSAGRSTSEIAFLVPKGTVSGEDYVWEATLLSSDGKPLTAAKKVLVSGVVLDETVLPSTVEPDNKCLVFQGRWKQDEPKSPSATWPGTAIHLRFRGSSLQMKANVPAYIGPKDSLDLAVIVDGDEANWKKIRLIQGEQNVVLAENLATGVHRASIVRLSDAPHGPLVVRSFSTDANGAFMRAERPSNRRIEFYGDSITEGGTTVPRVPNPSNKNGDRDYDNNNYFSFANITARALDADGRFICKGGMALSGPAFVPFSLPQVFDKLDFAGDPKTAKTVDFTLWQPDAVVIGIGHNDPFSKGYGEEKFAAAYAEFVGALRRAYPNAEIFCTDTTMSMDNNRQWEKAVMPLMKTDPKIHLNLFAQVDTGAHPHGPEHRNMAIGGGKQLNNLSDWIGDTLGW